MTINLTVTEVLDALHRAKAREKESGEDIPPNTFSGPEIRKAMGIGGDKFHRHMKEWIENGTCRVVHVRKFGVDGRLMNVRAYQFTART